jgi:hypothetical protein
MAGCKSRFSALAVLAYPNVGRAPVLEKHHFRSAPDLKQHMP